MTDQNTPAGQADAAAEAIRALNHLTQTPQADWEFPGDAYAVVGNLAMAAHRLPQALDQVASLVRSLAEGGRIRHAKGGDVSEEVAEALEALREAAGAAGAMGAALDRAHAALGPLGYRED